MTGKKVRTAHIAVTVWRSDDQWHSSPTHLPNYSVIIFPVLKFMARIDTPPAAEIVTVTMGKAKGGHR